MSQQECLVPDWIKDGFILCRESFVLSGIDNSKNILSVKTKPSCYRGFINIITQTVKLIFKIITGQKSNIL